MNGVMQFEFGNTLATESNFADQEFVDATATDSALGRLLQALFGLITLLKEYESSAWMTSFAQLTLAPRHRRLRLADKRPASNSCWTRPAVNRVVNV